MRSAFSFESSSSVRNMSAPPFEIASLSSLFVASMFWRFSSAEALSDSFCSRKGANCASWEADICAMVRVWIQKATPPIRTAVRRMAGSCSLSFCHMVGYGGDLTLLKVDVNHEWHANAMPWLSPVFRLLLSSLGTGWRHEPQPVRTGGL